MSKCHAETRLSMLRETKYRSSKNLKYINTHGLFIYYLLIKFSILISLKPSIYLQSPTYIKPQTERR